MPPAPTAGTIADGPIRILRLSFMARSAGGILAWGGRAYFAGGRPVRARHQNFSFAARRAPAQDGLPVASTAGEASPEFQNTDDVRMGAYESSSYSYFNALIGSTRDARCAGMKPAHSATSASTTAENASTAGSAPVI